MRILVFLILGLVLLTLQTSLLPIIPEWFGRPDLLFLLIVFVAIYMTIIEGVVLCLFLGTAMEVVSGSFLGMYILAYGVVFIMIRSFSSWFSMENSSPLPGIFALSYLLSQGLIYVFTSMLADESMVPWVWGEVLLRVLIVAVLSLPCHAIFQGVLKICDQRREKRSFFTRRVSKKGNRYRPRPKHNGL